MFFFIINWVGQDYFSPQAMAYVLYLACIGLLIRRATLKAPMIPFLLVVAVVAASHQITPMMLLSPSPPWSRCGGPPAGTCRCSAACTSPPGPYRRPELHAAQHQGAVVGLGQPVANASETLEKTATIEPARRWW